MTDAEMETKASDEALATDTGTIEGATEAEGTATIETDGTADEISAFVLSFKAPISSATPCGESVRYDGDFETIKSEIDKLSENDFGLVAELSTKLLTTKTKDLLVGSYLAYALSKKDGLAGFAEGTGVLNVLTENFWEGLFPDRMAARQSALTFFAQRASEALTGYKPSESEKETLTRSLARFNTLQSFLMDAMGDKAPALSGVGKALTEIERRLPKPKAESTQATRPSETAEVTSPAGIQSVSDANIAVAKACAFLRNADAKNPIPYRVLRSMRWSAIVLTPPNTDRKTQIPSPIEQRRTYLSSLLESGPSEKLLEEAESSFQEGAFHFWFELQRLVSGAMEKLGPDYDNARTALLEETAIIMRRVPDLKTLTYNDGTAFVSPLCADWLEAEIEPLFGSSEEAVGPASGASDEGGGLESQKKDAMNLLQKGDLPGAINMMRAGGDRDRSAKERFLRQLYMADLCMKGKRPSIARPILENLDHAIEQHGLVSWEPDLALTAWSSLHACYQEMMTKAAPADKTILSKHCGDIFEKICRIDAAYALSLPQ